MRTSASIDWPAARFGPCRIAVLEPEREVVETTHDRRVVDGERLGTVAQQEGLEVLAVDLLEPVAEEVVLDDAGDDGAQHVERREREAKLVLGQVAIDPQLPQQIPCRSQRLPTLPKAPASE